MPYVFFSLFCWALYWRSVNLTSSLVVDLEREKLVVIFGEKFRRCNGLLAPKLSGLLRIVSCER